MEAANLQDLSLDSTSIKAHQTSEEQKGNMENPQTQHIGVSRGGRSTKIHAVVDGLGNPIHVQLSAGQVNDCVVTADVLSHVPLEGTLLMADNAHGTKTICAFLAQQRVECCIPPKANALEPWPCDWWQYKERLLVECFFQKLKLFRRIATRYDKLARRFLAFVYLACVLIWLA